MNRLNKFAAALFALSVILSLLGCKAEYSFESVANSSIPIAETSAPDGIDASTEINGVMSFEKTIETESEKNRSVSKTPYTSLSEHTLTAKTTFVSI